jgi:hypothetical protein
LETNEFRRQSPINTNQMNQHNGSSASQAAKELIDSEIIERQKELVQEGQKMSIFLSFFITTLVVLFFMAMLVFTFQSIQDDLFDANPFVQVLTLASPVVALLALSILFNFKTITSPILFKIQKFLFWPVDFAYKVWSEEFRQEFIQKENTYQDVIETQEDTIETLEEKLNAQRHHGRNLEELLRERIGAQDYSESAIRSLLEHMGEYVLFVDSHGLVPDYYSRSVLNLVGYEPIGDSFTKVANFSHQEHVEFLSFLSHCVQNHMDFYQLESIAPKQSMYQNSSKNALVINWRYRPHYANNGQLKAIIAIGTRMDEQQQSSVASLNHSSNKVKKDQFVIDAKGLEQFSIELGAKTDFKLKKSFEENILRQPLKSLVGSLENTIYSTAEALGKEVEFDYYQSLNKKVSLKSYERLEPILRDLSYYLLNQQLETPHKRRQIGKVGCGQLQLECDLSQYGDKGSFFRLKIDGPGLSLDQLKADLLRAGFSLTQQEVEHVDYSVLFNKQLNQSYKDRYMSSEFTIAQPVDLSTIKSKVERMRGTIKIDSNPGLSTIVDIYLPESMI